jgi:hypothetical protein
MRILCREIFILIFFVFCFFYPFQMVLAGDNLCGIGKDIKVNNQKEISQQQNNILTDLLNTGTGLINNAIGSISSSSQSRISSEIVAQLLSLYFTLSNNEVSAQGYVCLPESMYYQVLDNLTNIILEIR